MARDSKVIFFLLIGALAMSFGSVVASNVKLGSSLSPTTVLTSIIVSAILFLIGGVFWMIVAKSFSRN